MTKGPANPNEEEQSDYTYANQEDLFFGANPVNCNSRRVGAFSIHEDINFEASVAQRRANLLTTQVSIGRLEHLVAGLAENDEDRLEPERLLVHLRCVRSRLEEIRSGLINKLENFHPAATPGIAH